MDRNSIIGLLLILAILVGYSYFNQPTAEQLAQRKHYSDSIAAVEQQRQQEAAIAQMEHQENEVESVKTLDSNSLKSKFGNISEKFFGEEEEFILKNNEVEVTISNKGARVNKVELLKYKRSDSAESLVQLFDKDEAEDYFVFNTKNDAFYTNKVYWELVEQKANSLVFKLDFDDEAYLESTFTLDDEGYGINQDFVMVNMDKYIQPNSLLTYYREVEVPKQELKAETERQKSTIYYRYLDEKPDYISETKYKTENLKIPVEWVSFKQQFFNSTVILKEGFLGDGEITVDSCDDDLSHVKNYKAVLDLPFENRRNEQFNLRFFYGPNHYQTLKSEKIELEGIIPLGWTLFRWVNKFLVIPTFNFLHKYISNYGIIILLLTLFIKLLLFPLVYKSYQSTAKMKLLKPELDAIKEKNKNDMTKTQMETMSLYKKAGVSPFGGCMPMLLQFPILIAMFTFFPSSFELRQESFLWAADLSRYDSIFDFPGGFSIPFYGDHVSLFTLLMTVSTIIYTRLNNQITAAGQQMKIISYLMPVMFLGFFNNYPAALSYYYFLANMITFGQQAIFKRFVDEDKLHAQIANSKKKKVSVKKSSFQKRLENYAKQKGIDPNTGRMKK